MDDQTDPSKWAKIIAPLSKTPYLYVFAALGLLSILGTIALVKLGAPTVVTLAVLVVLLVAMVLAYLAYRTHEHYKYLSITAGRTVTKPKKKKKQ